MSILHKCGCNCYPRLCSSKNDFYKNVKWAQVKCVCGMETKVCRGTKNIDLLENEAINIWNNGMKNNIEDTRVKHE